MSDEAKRANGDLDELSWGKLGAYLLFILVVVAIANGGWLLTAQQEAGSPVIWYYIGSFVALIGWIAWHKLGVTSRRL